MPWEPFVSGGKNVTDQSRRFRVDVAIGADKSNRNRAHAAKDARTSGFGHLGTDGRIPMRGYGHSGTNGRATKLVGEGGFEPPTT